MSSKVVILVHRNKPYVVDVDENLTVKAFKQKAASITGVSIEHIKLLGLRGDLHDDLPLRALNIKHNQKVLILGERATLARDLTQPLPPSPMPKYTNAPNLFDSLPIEIRLVIMSFLATNDLVTCARVCQAWRKLAESASLWRDLFTRKYFLFTDRLPNVPDGNWKQQYVKRILIDRRIAHGHSNNLAISLAPRTNCVCADVVWPKETSNYADINTVQIVGHHVISGDARGTVVLWDLTHSPSALPWSKKTDEYVASLDFADYQGVSALRVANNWMVVATTRGCICLFDLAAQRRARLLQGHAGEVHCVAINEERDLILSGSRDHCAKLWDGRTGTSIATLWASHVDVSHVQFGPPHYLITCGAAETVRVWDERLLKRGPLLSIPTRGHCFEFDGSRLWMGSTRHLECCFVDLQRAAYEFLEQRPQQTDTLVKPALLKFDGSADWLFVNDSCLLACGSSSNSVMLMSFDNT